MWLPKPNGVVCDSETGEEIAQCFASDQESRWSRACLLSLAPDLFTSLTDMVAHAERNFPPELKELVTQHKRILAEVSERYDRRGMEGTY